MKDELGNTVIIPQPKPELPDNIQLPSDKVTVINIDELKQNSVIIIKVDAETHMHKMAVMPIFAKLLSPYSSKFKEKGITIMLMTTQESLDIVPEEEMNKFGWHKKEKSLIINPFQK